MRLRLDLSYDGTDFHGWATQPDQRTVQGTLEEALQKVARVPVRVSVAGRTDAGVHARGQVCHLDLPPAVLATLPGRSPRPPAEALVTRLAGILPADVVVHAAREVPDSFDARFGALWRRYRYRISDAPAVHDPLRRDVMRHRNPLDVEAMDRASQALVGRHDFLSYCRPREGATTIRTLESVDVDRPASGQDAGLVVLTVRADAFCHSMVRSLTGALLAVGDGRRAPGWPAEALALRSREAGVDVAPPHGLTLEEVGYPADDLLAERARAARRVRTLDVGGASS